MNKYCKIYLDALVKTAAPGDRGEYGQGVDLDEKYQNLAKLNTTVKPAPTPVPTIGQLAAKAKPTITQPVQKTQDKGMLGDVVAVGGDRQKAQQISDKLKAIKSNVQAQQKGIMPDTPATRKLLGIPAGYKPGEADLNDVAGYE